MKEQMSGVLDLTAEQRMWIQQQIRVECSKPLSVAIMGQTGVGKSSLLNALFGTQLIVGDVRPTTKLREPVTVAGSTGHPMTFWDMPGIGESVRADESYLQMYRQMLIDSDVVLWAIHADNRSTAFDLSALGTMLESLPCDQGRTLAAKITFVLTKADLLMPPPWIYYRDGDKGSFAPSGNISKRLAEKAEYYQEVLVRPYGGLGLTETYNRENFSIDDARFSWDEHHVRYKGFMSEEMRAHFTQECPEFAGVFDRLADNQRVIPCSSQFRYNLVRLMVVIVNKLGESAIGRFQRLIGDASQLDEVPVRVMRKFGNLVVWDGRKSRVTFDLDDIKF